MVRRSLVGALCMLFLIGGLAGSRFGVNAQDATPAGEPIRVGFVYVSPIGDLGWTYAHDQGRLALEEALPNVETGYQESVPENPADAERVIRQFAQDGYDVIFTTSFGYMDPTINVAKDFPDTTFIHISGFKTAENVGTGFGKIEEPRFVSGQLAGAMTESNQIGYVAAFPIPEIIRGINAFTLGVREANPEATVRVVWTNTWFDPAKERAAAEALLDGGVDVIAQHQDSAGPQQAAEDRGLYGIGYNADMAPLAPDAVITSAIWNWGPYYIDIVESVTEEIRTTAEEEIARFKSGEETIYTIFTGPIADQTGEIRVPEGQSMTDEELLSMNWFVEGVQGDIPS
jgi:basic membrane protein A